MIRRPLRLVTLLALLAAALVVAATAFGAANRTAPPFSAAGTFKWDGPVTTSVSPLFDGTTCANPAPEGPKCDTTLVELKVPGTLAIVIDGWNDNSDLDLFFRKSDANGTYGEEAAPPPLGSGAGPEKLTAKNLPAGIYLVAVNYFQSVESGYNGSVTFTPAGAAPDPAATPTPTPTPAPGGGGSGGGGTGGGGATPQSDGGKLPTAGTLAVQVKAAGAKLKALAKSGAAVTVGCTVVCKATVTLTLDKKSAKKLKLGKKAVVVGKATVTIDRKQPPPVAVRLTAKAKKAFKKAKSVKLAVGVVAGDSSGGQTAKAGTKATFKK